MSLRTSAGSTAGAAATARPGGGAQVKSVLFVAMSLSIALAVLLGAGCHHKMGPPIADSPPVPLSAAPQPSPLEGGRDKGAPAFAPQPAPPPALGSEPSPGDTPLFVPYEHDGARIDRSLTSGAMGADPRRAGR